MKHPETLRSEAREIYERIERRHHVLYRRITSNKISFMEVVHFRRAVRKLRVAQKHTVYSDPDFLMRAKNDELEMSLYLKGRVSPRLHERIFRRQRPYNFAASSLQQRL